MICGKKRPPKTWFAKKYEALAPVMGERVRRCWAGIEAELPLETHGFTEVITEDEEVIRTPKTVGDDVIAIASVIDPYVRAQPDNFGVYAFARRWHACIYDLEYNALVSPQSEYAENQSFWETLPHICVYLHGQGAALPPAEVWEALLEELGSELRNAGPKGDNPFKHFDVNGFDELYTAQFNYLRQLRGADDKDAEPGMVGARRPIPRSTNADVIALADYWSKQLLSVKKVFGHEAIAARWKQSHVDVDAARKADPTAVFAKNNGFWRDYRTPGGARPVKEFLAKLTDGEVATIAAGLRDVKDRGTMAARHLQGDIYEVRADAATRSFRLLFSCEGKYRQILLSLSVYEKRTQKAPTQEIELAEKRLKGWRARAKN